MKRWLFPVVLPALALVFSAAPAAAEGASGALTVESRMATEITPARLAAALFAETNRVRRAHGLTPLRPLPELNAAAEDQASYMALVRHAGHGNALLGQSNVLERVLRHGLRPAEVAENVAAQPATVGTEALPCAAIAAGLVEAWMQSPGHRANLLSRKFTHLGCAARVVPVMGRAEYVFGVQVFSSRPPAELPPM